LSHTHLPGLSGVVGFLGVVVAAPSLYGCGSTTPTLNAVAVERAVAASILTQHDLRVRVSCPRTVPRRAGVVFTCTAGLDVGTYPVYVTETTAGGRVRYENRAPLATLDIARVQHAIERSIRAQRRLTSTVTCPAEVVRRTGIAFTCTATVAGRRYPFAVTEIAGSGRVRYVGLPPAGGRPRVSG
jgi:hypothetical protein